MKQRHKQRGDENFPVGSFLIRKTLRPLVFDYYRFARHGDDIADNPRLSPQEKLSRLDKTEDILYERLRGQSKKYAFIRSLREGFIRENLSFSLASDLLIAFRRDAEGFEYQTWGQLMEYCGYSAAPVGRFMLAIHNENPSTYLPAASLCAALQIINHLQDLKYDAKILKRVYIPTELMNKFGVSRQDFLRGSETAALTKLKRHILQKIKGMVKEAEILPAIVKSRGLKMEIGVILSLTKRMIQKLDKEDALSAEIKLSSFDWAYSFVAGALRGFFTKPKTLTTKGL